MSTTNSTPPDMIAQAGSLMAMLQNGNPIAVHIDGDDGAYIDGQIVQASAILAVAAELRELRNVLVGAMSEGADANGDPISFLRIDTGA